MHLYARVAVSSVYIRRYVNIEIKSRDPTRGRVSVSPSPSAVTRGVTPRRRRRRHPRLCATAHRETSSLRKIMRGSRSRPIIRTRVAVGVSRVVKTRRDDGRATAVRRAAVDEATTARNVARR